MAKLELVCEFQQGFQFRKDKKATIGYITEMKVGDTDFSKKFECADPCSDSGTVKAVGVLRRCNWDLGKTDPLVFVGQVTGDTKKKVELLTQKDMVSIEVKFKFVVYAFDNDANKYYKCFHCNDAELKGKIAKSGENLILDVGDVADPRVPKPENYRFHIQIDPADDAQDLHRAVSDSDKFARQWGIKEV